MLPAVGQMSVSLKRGAPALQSLRGPLDSEAVVLKLGVRNIGHGGTTTGTQKSCFNLHLSFSKKSINCHFAKFKIYRSPQFRSSADSSLQNSWPSANRSFPIVIENTALLLAAVFG